MLHATQQQTAEILLGLTTQKEYTSLQVAIKSKKILDIELRKQIISRLVVSGAIISEELNSFAEIHGSHEIAEFLLTLKPSENIIYMNLAN